MLELSNLCPTAELASHCEHYPKDPNGADAIFCIRYIQGFIDGAIATDERVAQNVAAEHSQKKRSLNEQLELAHRGSNVMARPTMLILSRRTFAIKNSCAQDRPKISRKEKCLASSFPARDAVYQILRKEYPCVTDDKSKASEADKKK